MRIYSATTLATLYRGLQSHEIHHLHQGANVGIIGVLEHFRKHLSRLSLPTNTT